MAKILIVEDEAAIADALIYALSTEGFRTAWQSLGERALGDLRGGGIDLVLLDIGLPDINGFEVCKTIRSFSDVPVIFLTARGDEVDRVVGLEIGADDYVVKPFSPREVAARVKAVLKRARPATGRQAANDFAVDEARAEIRFKGELLNLTRYEFRLLKTLIAEPGRVFSRDDLMSSAWEHPDVSLARTVDTHIKQLRSKLKSIDANSSPIRTHRGLGYSLASSAGKLDEH